MRSLSFAKMLRESRWTVVLCVLAAALALGLYFRTGLFDFCTFDDPSYVSANDMVQSKLSWANVLSAFSFSQPMYWHPVTTLSLMIEGQFFHMWAGGYHVLNALWHCGNVALFFVLALVLTGSRFAAFFCALFFAVHPAHVESVAWIAERKDVLSTFFGLATVLLYIRLGRRRGMLVAGCMYASYLLSLMAKPMFVTMPVLLLLLDYWPLRRLTGGDSPVADSPVADSPVADSPGADSPGADSPGADSPGADSPGAPGAAGAGPWPGSGLKRASALPELNRLVSCLREKMLFLALGLYAAFMTLSTHSDAQDRLDPDLWLKLANAFASIGKYLILFVWPSHQAVIYPFPDSVPLAQSLGGAAAVLALTGLCLWQVRRRPYLLVGWLWFLCALVPVIMPPKVGLHVAMADRWTYVPFLGLYLALGAWGAGLLSSAARPLARATLALVFLLPAVPLAFVQQRQLSTWESPLSMYEQALRVTKRNYLVLNNYGGLKLKAGDEETGERCFLEALEIYPDFAICRMNLGMYRLSKGRFDESIELLWSAVPRLAGVRQAYDAYTGLAYALGKKGRLVEAEHFLAAAIREQPKRSEAYMSWGRMARARGDISLAHEFFRQMSEGGSDIGTGEDLRRVMASLRKP